ncbi:hypothetical protein I8751_06125 [Nostocaceae cyanobacterium CENA357]|uniref:Uncharacterized protein n=1 Tax=Atlanticothrix silvestris CENA357 TaxID=1725252 RepID=A0A8J7L4F6_9CYAN|nr:hypothetical protein [Atlanticothrix silvestris]MBH8551962.1 hypothetical protein [Atlanticothrix silvestris CENA357]
MVSGQWSVVSGQWSLAADPPGDSYAVDFTPVTHGGNSLCTRYWLGSQLTTNN